MTIQLEPTSSLHFTIWVQIVVISLGIFSPIVIKVKPATCLHSPFSIKEVSGSANLFPTDSHFPVSQAIFPVATFLIPFFVNYRDVREEIRNIGKSAITNIKNGSILSLTRSSENLNIFLLEIFSG